MEFLKILFQIFLIVTKKGKQSSGNASRPGSPMGRSSEPIPISAPHNLKINPGTSSQEDMIKDTKHGITSWKIMVYICSKSN